MSLSDKSFSQNLIPEKQKDLALRYLENDACPAFVVYTAAKIILGNMIDAWECETINLEFKKLGLPVSETNLNKIYCGMALGSDQIILHHRKAFQNIIAVLNNQVPLVEVDEIFHTHEVAWAVVAFKAFRNDITLCFDYEPVQYAAQVMHNDGFILPPRALTFAQVELSRMNRNNELEEDVRKSANTPIVKVQLEKLADVDRYVTFMYEDCALKLKSLKL